MADKKISELNTASAVYDTDDFALVQDAETKQVNASTVKAYVKDGLSKSDVGLSAVTNDAQLKIASNLSDINNAATARTNLGLAIGTDVQAYDADLTAWAGKTAPTGDAVGTSDTQTLTNKTISGSSNTLSNIGNSSLTNSSITVNGNAVSLGGSTTVSAATTNTLTIGTGLSGTSFNGSAATTIAIDSTIATLTGTQTLTNKTISGASNTLSNIANASLSNSAITFGATSQALGSTVSALNAVSIGGTTPAAGSFTTLSASSTVSGTGFSTYLASPPAIGGTAPAAGSFTTLSASSTVTLSGGTANGVLYLNGSKVATSGTGLVFDGTNLGIGTSSAISGARLLVVGGNQHIRNAAGGTTRFIFGPSTNTTEYGGLIYDDSDGSMSYGTIANYAAKFITNNTVRAIIDTSGNVGIGTSSPGYKLDVRGSATTGAAAVFSAVSIPDTNGNRGGFGVVNASGGYLGGIAAQQIVGGNYPNSVGRLDVWVQNGAGTVTAATFDSAGNLGLGVTPSAWGSGRPALEAAGFGLQSFSAGLMLLHQNSYYNGTNYIYKTTAAAGMYAQTSGQHQWFTAPSGTAGSAISFTQAMTLDASGNLYTGMTTGTGIQKVNWSGPNSGDTATSGWSNVSSVAINVSTLFPTLSVVSGATLSFILQIVTSSNTSAATSSRILCLRRGDSTWAFGTPETIGAVTVTPSGSSNTITLTFSGGGQYGICRVMALGY